jgi:hypothetical protein
MIDETDRDPTRDPALESVLRDLGPEPPMEAVDWDRLAGAISARARERLAVRDRKVVWWQPMAAWARPAIPLGLAAALALFLVLRSVAGSDENLAGAPESADAVGPAEAILLGDELAQSIYRGDSPTLLQAAFGYEEQTP